MSTPAAKRLFAGPVLAAAVCALAGLVLFQFFGNASRGWVDTPSVFWWAVSQWLDPNADSEHGWLILGLSAWLLWRNLRANEPGDEARSHIHAVEPRRTRSDAKANGHSQTEISNLKSEIAAPAAAMLVALALHAIGFVAQQARLSLLAVLLFAWGVLRLGGGTRWGSAALFPLAFLIFAIPVNILDSLGFWLRVWVVDASATIARAAGVGVLQSGTQLVAPDGRYNYDVAAACSGVRSLTAMAALSLLAGYLNFNGWGRRALILLLCLPLVYLGNVARIVAIIFAAQIGGTTWGDLAHEIMGYGIFAIVLGGVLAAIAALRRWWPEEAEVGGRWSVVGERRTEDGVSSEALAKEEGLRTKDQGPRTEDRGRNSESGGAAAYIVLSVILVLSLAEMLFLGKIAASPARGEVGIVLADGGTDPVDLPAFLGTEWIGRRTAVTAIEREILPPDTGFSRKLYVDLSNPSRQVLLSIVLSGRDRTSIHRPELCLVGQGWTVTGTFSHRFRHPEPGAGFIPATLLRVQREVQTRSGRSIVPQLVAYWFVGGQTTVASHLERVLQDSWNRVSRGRADRWAYVLMQTDAGDGEAAALARMQAVLDGTLPVFAPAARLAQNR